MWIIDSLFRSDKAPPLERKITRPSISLAAEATVPVQPSKSELSYIEADKADRLIDEVEILVANMKKVGLKTEHVESHLRIAKADVASARKELKKPDHDMALAVAQTSCNFSRLAKKDALDALGKNQSLTEACAHARTKWSAVSADVVEASRFGKKIRSSAIDPKWKCLRGLDQAAEMRVKQIERLLNAAGKQLATGNLEKAERNIDRVKAWLDQASGYLVTCMALGQYLAISEIMPADRPNAAYDLAMWVNKTFYYDMPAEASIRLSEAGDFYAAAKSPYDAESHSKVLEHSLATIDLFEAEMQGWVVKCAARRAKKNPQTWTIRDRGTQKYFTYLERENAHEFRDRFAPALTAKEQIDRNSSSCFCCH